jgi:protoheme IX farnesyltransferase
MYHPLIATSVGLFLLFSCGFVSRSRPDGATRRLAKWVVGTFLAQMAFGIANLAFLAPIWMQIVHLALSDLIWIAMVLMGISALAESKAEQEQEQERERRQEPAARQGFVAALKAYVALTKPRVVSLLVFTTVAAMFVADRGFPGLLPILLVSIGGYMAAGAANTFNMVYERDLDVAMERTSHRPTVTHALSNTQALTFGFALAVGSFAVLWGAFNLLAAMTWPGCFSTSSSTRWRSSAAPRRIS